MTIKELLKRYLERKSFIVFIFDVIIKYGILVV